MATLATGCISWNVDSARNLARLTSFGSTPPVTVRNRPQNPLSQTLNLFGRGGPQPSERTVQILRRYDLSDAYETDPDQAVNQLFEYSSQNHSLELAYAWTELAYIRAEAVRAQGNDEAAMKWYTSAAAEAYHFLFNEQHQNERNAYDPVFRQVCDLYNQSLEGMLRILDKHEMLVANQAYEVETDNHQFTFSIRVNGRWKDHRFKEIRFVSDLRVEGLNNQYRTFGLGVPLVAVRDEGDASRPDEAYYPPDLAMPMTAFFHVPKHLHEGAAGPEHQTCVLELFDPLEQTLVSVGGQTVPLESDISTPLAYYLKDPLINSDVFATVALIDGDFARQFRGLYMLEPYDPEKIPVVMVHGLWSSPITWTEMYNDLRSDANLREKYQFWFYLYPSGQPFWVSAGQMRKDLAEAQRKLDPYHQSATMNQTVLIGHSMGGLVSRLQTLNSHDDFWGTISDQSFENIQGNSDDIELLRETVFFSANPSIKRVITLGTPHQGSRFANTTTRWVSNQLFRLPTPLQQANRLVSMNPELFDNPRVLKIRTSVDSLAPESPFFEAMATAERAPWVQYHNVVGQAELSGISGFVSRQFTGEGDGVVSVESARSPDTTSEIVVVAEHSEVHQHPRSILEVKRILREHLQTVDMIGTNGRAMQATRPTNVPLQPIILSDTLQNPGEVEAEQGVRAVNFEEANR